MKHRLLQYKILSIVIFLAVAVTPLVGGPKKGNKIEEAIKPAKDKKPHPPHPEHPDKPDHYGSPANHDHGEGDKGHHGKRP